MGLKVLLVDGDLRRPSLHLKLGLNNGAGLSNYLTGAATPLEVLQPRTALAWRPAPGTVVRTGFGLFSDMLPGSVADLAGANPLRRTVPPDAQPAPRREFEVGWKQELEIARPISALRRRGGWVGVL